MTDGKTFNKDRYFGDYGHKSIQAKFSVDECPYCHYPIQGNDSGLPGEYISKGPKGWGHAGCVNAKWHYNHGGGHPLCSTQTSSQLRVTTDWSEVTCKKCLAMEANKEAYEEAKRATTEKLGPWNTNDHYVWDAEFELEEDRQLRARDLPPTHENRARKSAREYSELYVKTGNELYVQAIVPTMTDKGVDEEEALRLAVTWLEEEFEGEQ